MEHRFYVSLKVNLFFDCFYFSDVALADLEKEKKLSFVKAWEDSEITKAENK